MWQHNIVCLFSESLILQKSFFNLKRRMYEVEKDMQRVAAPPLAGVQGVESCCVVAEVSVVAGVSSCH